MKTFAKRLGAVMLAAVMSIGVFGSCDKGGDSSSSQSGTDAADALGGATIEYVWDGVDIGGGGYITGIVFNPSQSGLVYCRTDIGGAYRYDVGQGKWICITDFFGDESEWVYTGIESIATDPVEPNRVYAACGTYGDEALIICSDDYGATWTRTYIEATCGGNQSGRGCGERLVVDPNDNSIIYFGSRNHGLFVSKDYGVTFSPVESFPTKGNYSQESNSVGLTWVLFNKASSEAGKATNQIFVGVADTSGNTVYVSNDAGSTWECVGGAPAGYYPISSDISSDGQVYIAYSNTAGPNVEPESGYVYKLDTATLEFTDITPAIPEGVANHGFGGISVDPNDPNRIITSALGLYWPIKGILYYSTDGGQTWFNTSTHGKTVNHSSQGWVDTLAGANTVGWWITTVEINPFNSNEAFYTTGYAVMRASGIQDMENGATVIDIFSKGIEETAVFEVVCPPGDPDLYSIMGDLGGFVHESVDVAPGADAIFMTSQVSSDMDCGWLNTDVVVRCGKGPNGSGNPLVYSNDGGYTFHSANLPAGCEQAVGGSVAVAADGSSFIWAPSGVSATAYVTSDFGETWTECEGLPYKCTLAADRVNPLKYYASVNGVLYSSADGGKSFTMVNGLVLEGAQMYTVSGHEDELWLCGGGYMFHSTDGGVTFETHKNIDANCMGFGKGLTDDTYAIYCIGTTEEHGYGFYRSTDMCQTWERLNDDWHLFGNTSANCITGDPDIFGRVYFVSNGRGIIRGDDPAYFTSETE